jgi:hypothetical protein
MCRPPSGHDPCIENLPGVLYACCGHGVEPGYISFENGVIIRGVFTEIERSPESAHLLSSPANARRLLESIARSRAALTELMKLDQELGLE